MQLPLEAGAPCSPCGQGETPAVGSAALGTWLSAGGQTHPRNRSSLWGQGSESGPFLSPLWALRTVWGQCWQDVDSAGHSPDVGSSSS